MKMNKVFSVIMIAVMLLSLSCNVVFANIAGITINTNKTTNASNKVANIGGQVINIVRTVGTVAAVVTLIILGVKYMMGSAEEKAEYKKTLMPYVLGAVLVLAAVNIVNWVFSAAGGFFA